MGTKKDKDWFDRNEIVQVLEGLIRKYPPTSEKNQKMAYQAFLEKYPESVIFTVWQGHYVTTKKPEAIATSLIKAIDVKKKIGHIKEREHYKHPGRPRNKEWELFSKADDILAMNTMLKWEKIGIDIIEYEELRDAMILGMIYKQKDIAEKVTPRWSREAIDKMIDEIRTLRSVQFIFLKELAASVESKDPYFIKNAQYNFKWLTGKGIEDYLLEATPLTGRGRKINHNTLLIGIKNARAYSRQGKIEKTHSFYERDKLSYLCYLAASIELIFRKPLDRMERDIAKKRAKLAIYHLAEYYSIQLSELIFSPFSNDAYRSASLLGYEAFSETAKQTEFHHDCENGETTKQDSPPKENELFSSRNLQKLVEYRISQEETLKKELTEILSDLDKR
ncbi:MAG: hypothetical protein K8I29_08745 [Alphaproteobacteria bacterium]|uniref:Uncharacterized protein n=1 Tax=Candidatus Nitrobium versatile TaxID=2884831 RepID=A0A953JCL6_9BACT|nr:hypothetical protein [Candidatus Nitrobium versatile]